MAPVLFNLYMSAVIKKSHAAVADDAGIGISVARHRTDRLFNARSVACASMPILECQFADDAALLASTREGAERAIIAFQDVAAGFGLKVNTSKTKFMPVGVGLSPSDSVPIAARSGTVDCVQSFPYLGSLVTPDARSSFDVSQRIAAASRAFGQLKSADFTNPDFTLFTKRRVYTATVLTVLLYGSECCTVRQGDLTHLEVFHHQCLRSILGGEPQAPVD